MDRKALAKLISARFIVDAILEDYCKLVSKLENSEIKQVKERIIKRSDELLAEFIKQNPLSEESK